MSTNTAPPKFRGYPCPVYHLPYISNAISKKFFTFTCNSSVGETPSQFPKRSMGGYFFSSRQPAQAKPLSSYTAGLCTTDTSCRLAFWFPLIYCRPTSPLDSLSPLVWGSFFIVQSYKNYMFPPSKQRKTILKRLIFICFFVTFFITLISPQYPHVSICRLALPCPASCRFSPALTGCLKPFQVLMLYIL